MKKAIAALVAKIPPQDLVQVMTALCDVAQSVVTVRKVNAARDVAIAAIHHKHELYREVFEKLFAERREVIHKQFEVLDRGMATNDQAVILGALQALGQIVAKSPFTDLKQLAAALEGGETIEI